MTLLTSFNVSVNDEQGGDVPSGSLVEWRSNFAEHGPRKVV